MMNSEPRGVATTAKLAGHPIHPMLIPFPIALLVAALASDIAYLATEDSFWARGAFWLLAAALLMGAAAAVAGFIDFFGNPRIRSMSDAWQHMIGNIVVVALAIANLVLRWGREAVEGVPNSGVLLSVLTVLILLFTGWKGGSLVYRHRVGMHPEEPGQMEKRTRHLVVRSDGVQTGAEN